MICQTKPKGATTRMKASNMQVVLILMVLIMLLLKRVCFLAFFKIYLDGETWFI